MKQAFLVLGFGIFAVHPAWAAHCRYDRTSITFGQDSQGHIMAPAAVPCHIFFRSARDRTQWSVAQEPAHGMLKPVGDRGWDYVPMRGYSGPDAFAVQVSGETMGRYVHSGTSRISFAVDVVP